MQQLLRTVRPRARIVVVAYVAIAFRQPSARGVSGYLERDYSGPIKKVDETVSQRVFSFMTCGTNFLPSAQAHERMPVLLDTDEKFDQWLNGSEEEALKLAQPYPEDGMVVVQKGGARKDMLGAS